MPVMETLLPADPQSAGRARRFVVTALHTTGQERHSDTTELLVSELVTNALLHSGSEVGLRVVAGGPTVRVEVRDASPVLPKPARHAADAATGRGLEMVELLSSRWGVETREPGKVVWFEVGEPSSRPDRETADDEPSGHEIGASDSPEGAAPEAARTVQLLGLPVALYLAMLQQNDALLREFTLRAFADAASEEPGPPNATEQSAVGDLRAEVQAAAEAGEARADLPVAVGPRAREASAQLLATLSEADLLSSSGELLTPPALPEIRGCRRWWLGQIVTQLDGAPPTPWSDHVAEPLDTATPMVQVDHRRVLDQLGDAIVVGDDLNRIVHLNPSAERLLGWPAGELVGQRLTTIIPERLHDAHVVGYTSYLLTGTPRLIGRPVRVPARRRDGSEVPIELLLAAFSGPGGRQMFVGSLRDLTDRDRSGERRLVDRGLGALEEIAAAVVPHARPWEVRDLARLTVDAVVRHLGWRFGAAWVPEDGAAYLRCTDVSEANSGAASGFGTLTLRQRLRRGAGLPGRVWESGEAAWITDVVADANFPRASAAVQSGLRSAFAFGLRRAPQAEVEAVAEFYTDQLLEEDTSLLSVMTTIGVIAGAAAAR